MPEIPEPTVRVTRYEVSCLQPEDHTNADLYTLTVESRGRDSWAVLRGSVAYAYDGTPSWEPIPSERTEDWIHRHRFDLETALHLAKRIAPTLTVNGYTVADALAVEVSP